MQKLKTTVVALMLGAAVMSGSMASADENQGHVIQYDKLAWQPAGDGAEAAILWGNEKDGNAVWVFRMQPGTEFPLHAHTDDYHGLAIQGNWVHIDADGNEMTTAQDSFVFVKGGEFHGDRCAGPEVCITLVDLDGPRDLYFPK